MDINKRLEYILNKYGWTKYKLSKESNLPESTLSNIFHRGTTPTLATLEVICKTLGITLAEFFSDNECVEMTPELKEFYEDWICLSPEKKAYLLQTMKYIK
ncbi:MAG: helix-turn-helix domain-containing protein [Clostridia bacterium]